MNWEKIASKDNKLIKHIGKLASSSKYRREQNAYVSEGVKQLREAIRDGAAIETVIWAETDFRESSQEYAELIERLDSYECRKAVVPDALYSYISILENHFGPLFVCGIEPCAPLQKGGYIALDGVQDPGNIGTVIRTAEAFGVSGVILLEGCADVYQPKTVRAAMGSVFRERIYRMTADEMFDAAKELEMPVFVTALYEDSRDIGEADISDSIVIIGSEGHGARRENIDRSGGSLFIPMSGKTESLNAAVAASIVMWEMRKWRASTGSGSAN